MNISGRAMLAPLSTFTDLPFRLLCQKHEAQGAVVPLVSAKALLMHNGDTNELDPDHRERFVGVQLFGSNASDIGKAASLVAKRFDFIKFIDINCACPVAKVVRTGAGSALLRKPDAVVEMIRAAKGAGFPVTVKIRKLKDARSTLEFCLACEDAGVDAIFFHGRLPSQGYSGDADWDAISHVAQHVSVPVIGSGDVRSLAQGGLLCKKSGCASFMIGRAAMADPAVFESASAPAPTLERKRSLFLEYASLCEELDARRFSDLKSKAIQFFSGFGNSAAVRNKICWCRDESELMNLLEL